MAQADKIYERFHAGLIKGFITDRIVEESTKRSIINSIESIIFENKSLSVFQIFFDSKKLNKFRIIDNNFYNIYQYPWNLRGYKRSAIREVKAFTGLKVYKQWFRENGDGGSARG